jgi:hypothetical protein
MAINPKSQEDQDDLNKRLRSLKIDRGWYFVEYGPPVASSPFATLHLVIPGKADEGQVAQILRAVNDL